MTVPTEQEPTPTVAGKVTERVESGTKSVGTPPTPAPNVSSTTTDGENSQMEIPQAAGVGTSAEKNSALATIARRPFARKSISRYLFDPNDDRNSEQQGKLWEFNLVWDRLSLARLDNYIL